LQYYPDATPNLHGIEYICKNFSWPYGFPSHASPATPGVIAEGGELGYSLASAYGMALGRPERTIAVLIGDGELETATALASLNLNKILNSDHNGWVIPILHLNGYKISAPTIYGRSSERELLQMFRGFGFKPIIIDGTNTDEFQLALADIDRSSFIIMKTPKGYGGPKELDGLKIEGNCASHQVPLPLAKSDKVQLEMLEDWLKSYGAPELLKNREGFEL
jgi:xylulose-5-phosphate/fructose-6-phosphate phosphoketolase